MPIRQPLAVSVQVQLSYTWYTLTELETALGKVKVCLFETSYWCEGTTLNAQAVMSTGV